MNPKFKLTPSQLKAIKNSAKGVLPAFLGGAVAKGTSGLIGGAVGRAIKKK